MIFAVVFVVIIFFYVVAVYNTFIRKRNSIENTFGAIDVMLKKRYDLLPNLVASVQQYAKHEQNLFSKVSELRAKQFGSLTEKEKSDFDQAFTQASRRFFAVAEEYPDLKASENFLQLQRALNEIEEQLAAARRTYNALVVDYNNAVMTFPSSLVAGMFHFPKKEVLETPAEEQVNPDVKKLFNS